MTLCLKDLSNKTNVKLNKECDDVTFQNVDLRTVGYVQRDPCIVDI